MDSDNIKVTSSVERTLVEVEAVLEFAKVERKEIKAVTQIVHFSPDLDNDSVRLLELDSDVLDALSQGDKIVIRGDKEDGAVLCTKNKSYDIKGAEISNAMLIMPNLQFGDSLPEDGPAQLHHRQVTSTLHSYYELRQCKPKLKKLKTILEENPYNGWENEEDSEHRGNKYTLNDILNMVQASETEIEVALEKLHAVQIDGFWRVLDFEFLTQVLNHIIQMCEENDWLSTGIPMEECLNTLQELFPRMVLEHIIKMYADKVLTSSNSEEEDEPLTIDIDYYRLNEDKICRFFAELNLREAGKFNLKDFLSVWQKCVPEGMKTGLYQIEGMALVDQNSTPETIMYLNVADLPEEVEERFNFLFRTREKWSLEDITPFISDLATETTDVKALLTKYARASTHNGIKVYNSRKPVT
ncbi:hypothetical protein ACJMK2_042474 [Sinanodonta woodiana]|uniref:Sister chromatid cohesion protein DCC1 n=1 Tax=Sinanodonta woodiana TaxID=1069815 RepID=A0ABD3WAT5_SINWO